jgi:hypothetical protein
MATSPNYDAQLRSTTSAAQAYNKGNEPDPNDGIDTISQLVRDRYTSVYLSRASLNATLIDCYNKRRGNICGEEAEVANELAHVALDFEKDRVNIAIAAIQDLIIQSLEFPMLEPTPIPTLSADANNAILQKIKEKLISNNFQGSPEELIAVTKEVKREAQALENATVHTATMAMEKKIRDYLVETDFANTMTQVIDDFVTYPYACVKTISWEAKPVPTFSAKGSNVTIKNTAQLTVKRVSPFDIFFPATARTVTDAAFIIETKHITVAQLANLKKLPNYFKDKINEALVLLADGANNSMDWMNLTNLETNVQINSLLGHNDAKLITILEHHGTVSGRTLHDDYGMKDCALDQFYEVVAEVVAGRCIHLRKAMYNAAEARPYAIESFERLNGSMIGVGVIQRCTKAAKVARSFMYSAIRNAAASSEPTGEVDYSRIKDYVNVEDVGQFPTGMIFPVTQPISNNGAKAFSFYDVPNNTPSMLNGMKFFLQLLEEASGIPSIVTGDLGQSGQTLGRSFRGMALVLAAASKTLKAPLSRLDNMVETVINHIQQYELLYGADDRVKGDARVLARGSISLIMKEAQAASRSETLQNAIQLAQTGTVPPQLIQELVAQVMEDNGVDTQRFFPDLQTQELTNAQQLGTTQAPSFNGQNLTV